MGTTRCAAVLLVLVGAAFAQEGGKDKEAPPARRATRVLVLEPSVLQRYELPPADPKAEIEPVEVGERLAATLRLMFCGEDVAAGARAVRTARSTRGPALLVMSTAEDVAVAQAVTEQLRKEEPLQARLQVSLVALPLSLARESGLEKGVVVPADEAKLQALMRLAAKHAGELRNLPEVTASPLRPFDLAAAARDGVPEAQRLRVRGEMLPIGAAEVAVRVHMVRGALPAEPTRTPEKALLQPIVRLEAGKAVMVMAVEGEVATVLVVRCVELANAPLPKPDKR